MERWKLNVFPIQETKSSSVERHWATDMWGRRHFDYIHRPAVGTAGGILVGWNTNVIEVLDSRVGEFLVSGLCKNKEDGGE